MSRRCLSLFATVAIFAGCVPVTEPLSDASTTEPDKRLIGKWYCKWDNMTIDVPDVKGNSKGLMRAVFGDNRYKTPDEETESVGQGVLRMTEKTGALWFHITTIDKQTYANICMANSIKLREEREKNAWAIQEKIVFAEFAEEGEFQKWLNDKDRRYWIFKLSFNGDKLVVDFGKMDKIELPPRDILGARGVRLSVSQPAFVAIQQKEMIKMMTAPEWDGCYRTPAGWLTKFLDMNKEVIYDGSNQRKYERFLKPKQEQPCAGTSTTIPKGATVEVTPALSLPLSCAFNATRPSIGYCASGGATK